MTLHRGKLATHPEILAVRPLTREDLALLVDKRGPGNDGRPLQGAVARFRDPHHRLARLFAMGLRLHEVVERSGYSYNRCHTFSTDPAFQELVAKYRDKVDLAFAERADEFYEQATANMRKAEAMLAEKIEAAEESGEFLPTRDLIAITADRMDRFGYGKRTTNTNINVDFAAKLESAIARSGKTIDGVVSAPASSTPVGTFPTRVVNPPETKQPAPRIQRRA